MVEVQFLFPLIEVKLCQESIPFFCIWIFGKFVQDIFDINST